MADIINEYDIDDHLRRSEKAVTEKSHSNPSRRDFLGATAIAATGTMLGAE
jgi:hypothetical protein